MSFKTLLTIALVIAISFGLEAQELLQPTNGISVRKTAYITLQDGTTIEGNVKKLKRKKGLIKLVRIKTEQDGKQDIAPEDIAYMYLPPSGLDKLANSLENAFDTQQWGAEEVDHELIKEGYAYYEQSDVYVKKDERTMLMQLLNPHFATKIRVYHDPFAKETASVGVRGFTVAGGIDKSYYIKHGDETAFRLKKKHYKKGKFAELYKDCAAVAEQYGDDIDWDELVEHIMAYSKCGE